MTHMRPYIALTCGEPAGIGPDLCVLLAKEELPAHIIAIADKNLLRERAQALGLSIEINDFRNRPDFKDDPGVLNVAHVPLVQPSVPGKLNPQNSAYVLDTLKRAAEGCLNHTYDAMVTAPVHKAVINDAGYQFSGHTEFLAELSHTPRVVMMLAGPAMRVALATTHLALKDVAYSLNQADLETTLRIVHDDLQKRFGIAKPRILVAGLNPHSGESGHLGREEIEIISPVMDKLKQEGMALRGPLPADTLFTPQNLKEADCILTMYHDQGLPVLKYASFGNAVNITLGLPFIRTSVDHGTALELAGTGRIDTGSLRTAIQTAAELAQRAKAAST